MSTSAGVLMDDLSNAKVSFKHIFKPLGKYIIIRSVGEIKRVSSLIAIPDGMKETHSSHRQWEDNENIVFAIGDEVTKVGIGDRVFLDSHVKLRRLDKITELVESKTGVSFKVEVKDDKGNVINTEDTEKYFAVCEEDIICIIN